MSDDEKIRFDCSACGKAISVNQKMAGRTGKCPACEAAIQVPSLGRPPVRATPVALPSGDAPVVARVRQEVD